MNNELRPQPQTHHSYIKVHRNDGEKALDFFDRCVKELELSPEEAVAMARALIKNLDIQNGPYRSQQHG